MGDMNAGVFEIARERDPEEYDRLRDLAVETRVPVMFGASPGGRDSLPFQRLLGALDETAAAGGKMIGQAHSRAISTLWSFKTKLPYDDLPGWAEMRSRPLAEQKAALSDPETRRRLVEVAANPPPPSRQRAGGEQSIPRGNGYNYVRVLLDPLGENPTLAELAEAGGTHPADIVIQHALDSDFEVFFCQELTFGDEATLRAAINHPQTVVTFSDSGAHVSQIVDCSLQSHFLGYWVRKKQALPLEAAIRKLTFDLARAWNIPDRGLLRVGAAADVVVFDPETVGPAMPEIARDLPAGGLRLTQRSHGFKTSIVNGVVTLRDGDKPTGDYAGTILKGALA
jgi:N-acyl-D-aspartate/D-glutamate deacylase